METEDKNRDELMFCQECLTITRGDDHTCQHVKTWTGWVEWAD